MEISKSDWKLFRELISDWQENYMKKLNAEYIELLQRDDRNASDNFWELEKRIFEDKKKPGVQLQLRKGDAIWDIAKLIHDGAITYDDLSDFSEELKDAVRLILSR